MTSLRFTEGPYALDIKLPTRWISALRGEVIEATEEEATLLLALPGWESVSPATPSEEDES